MGCVLSIIDHVRLLPGRTYIVDGLGLHGAGALDSDCAARLPEQREARWLFSNMLAC